MSETKCPMPDDVCEQCGYRCAPQPSVPSGEAVRNALRRVLDNADWDDLADLANAMTGQRDVNTHEMADALLAAPPQDRVSEAMVERLCEELMQECDAGGPVLECDIFLGEASWSCRTDAVRRALTAALAPPRRAPSGDGKGKP